MEINIYELDFVYSIGSSAPPLPKSPPHTFGALKVPGPGRSSA